MRPSQASGPASVRPSHAYEAASVSRRGLRLPPFQALLDAHGRELRGLLVAMVGPEEADDCYQDAWLAALHAYPRLRDGANLRAWILRIAHNKAIDRLRQRQRAPLAAGAPGEPDSAAVDASPARLDHLGLWARVASLPPKQRAAVALRFIVDASYTEIGAAMSTSQQAARRNVHEGLKRLRKELSGEWC